MQKQKPVPIITEQEKKTKKAFLRTVEAVIAIGIMLVFLAAMTPRPQYSEPRELINALSILENDPDFRNCVLSNQSCAYEYIDEFIPDKYTYNITISSDPNDLFTDLPASKHVSSDSIFVAGNSTDYNATIVRLYYWTR